jgi:peroxiredoxin
MLEVGQQVPDVSIWTTPQERKTIAELVGEGRALFLFYLFDWSAT